MIKCFIETSVFLRFFIRDDERKFQDSINFFSLIEKGEIKPYTSSVVLQEVFYILNKRYRYTKLKVLQALREVLSMRNMTLIENTDTPRSLGYFKKYNIKFGDSFIAAQVPKNVKLVTYDSDFSKIKSLATVTPADLI